MTALQSNFVHCIIAVKRKSPKIPADSFVDLQAFMADLAEDMGARQLAAGGAGDHLHQLFALPTTLALSDLISEVKLVSQRWISATLPGCSGFEWDDDFTMFSVGMSQVRETSAYIERQLECHRKIDYGKEMMLFREAHKIGIADHARISPQAETQA